MSAVDQRLEHPAACRLLVDPELLGYERCLGREREALTLVVTDQSHSSACNPSSIFFGMVHLLFDSSGSGIRTGALQSACVRVAPASASNPESAAAAVLTDFWKYQTGSYIDGIGPRAGTWT